MQKVRLAAAPGAASQLVPSHRSGRFLAALVAKINACKRLIPCLV
jgi:hypothetical protein